MKWILYIPSLQRFLQSVAIGFDRNPWGKAMAALMFSIYFAAVTRLMRNASSINNTYSRNFEIVLNMR